MASSTAKRAVRNEVHKAVRAELIESVKDVIQGLLNPLGDTSKLYIKPSQNTDPTKANVKVFGTSDLTSNLCNVLEAVLIHGIKDSYANKFSSFFSSSPDRMPVPNFWPVVMSVSHKDDIKEVCCLSFITSDVGRGRAWLRLVINGSQFTSYMDALTRESGVLKDYYNSCALLRDVDSCTQLIGMLQQLQSLHFQLATNSAVLNTWTLTPLVLARLCNPPSGHFVSGLVSQVQLATDAASIANDEDKFSSRARLVDEESPLNEHLFNAILACTPDTRFIGDGIEGDIDEDSTPKRKPLVVRTLHPKFDREGNPYRPPAFFLSNDEHDHAGSEDEEEDGTKENELKYSSRDVKEAETSGDLDNITEESESLVGSFILDQTNSDDGSTVVSSSSLDYTTLISKQLDRVDYRFITAEMPSLKTVALPESQEQKQEEDKQSTHSQTSDGSPKSLASQDYEIVEENEALRSTRHSLLVSKLCTQYGLDEQNYQCYQCRAFIGMLYGEFRVCTMDGRSYCTKCHSDKVSIIPSRVLFNWDMRQYPVCDNTYKWLQDNLDSPLLDIRATNPKLYAHIDVLRELRTLRTQLLYLRAYLFTCSTPGVKDRLHKLVWPREHMYEHVHLYTVNDLLVIARGGVLPEMQEAVAFARRHVKNCHRCMARGFHCEVCSSNDVLFPFELEGAQTCPSCSAVYHRSCVKNMTRCRRCERKRKRRIEQQQRHSEEVEGSR